VSPGRGLRRALVALGCVLGLGLAAPPATAANEIRVLARVGALSPALLQKFEHDTGITVRLVEVADHRAIVARLGAAPPSGFDIAFPRDYDVAALIEAGRLERIWADRLPGFWNIEDPWRSRAFDPRNEFTIPHQWGTTAFAVDTTIHKGDIDSLTLLFDPPPDLRQRVGLIDDSDLVQFALLRAGEPRCTTDPARLGRARERLLPLLATARLVPPSQAAQALADPGLALAVAWNGDAMRAREGRPALAFAYPREGNLVWTDVVAVPAQPPNRANALKFLAFTLRPENAALETNHNGFATMIRGSEAFIAAPVLAAPEMVAPWPAKVEFLMSCGGAAHRAHDVLWTDAKRRAGLRP